MRFFLEKGEKEFHGDEGVHASFVLWLHTHNVAAGDTLAELDAQLEFYIEFLWGTDGICHTGLWGSSEAL